MSDSQIENMGSEVLTPSEPLTTPPEAPEAPADISTPEVVNNTTQDTITENTQEPPESQKTEETLKAQEPTTAQPGTGTAQIPVNEPLVKVSPARELLMKARNAIQFRKRKKLDRIMALFLKKSQISNKDVGEFLHVSDATATRYLDILEKENKIKQVGKTGHAVFYSKV